ncbi:hypothetical protein PNOK_0203600 [Pyrrhoderma noxium]|uniref:Uncharacterized protein n=1 Tax=Pyrrhoderma noxium TaxID=2282107 RepID=A0A286URB1_9AGAM|nr:hypothetical protein PNOK_0203600 [Pyrrhoderma noxium]
MATPMANSLSMNSPHDTVISEMDKKIRELRFSLNTEIPGSPETVGGINPSTRIRREDENIYDPYDGQSIGLMVPGSFSEDEDDVWTHLMKIRTLQCEIARLHTVMENAGENDRFGEQGEDVPIDIEEDVKAAKAAEFAKLSDKFNERKVAINGIMAKLESLSHTINEFHSSRAPVFRYVHPQRSTNKHLDSSEDKADQENSKILSNSLMSDSQDALFKDSPESLSQNL